jgi:GDP-4-dehydro-6-deoxy-D-mannose reductase
MNAKSPTVLITGACGFCATHLARALAAEDRVRVVGTDLAAAPSSDAPFADYHAADLAQPGTAAALVRQVRPDMLFHLAGRFRGTQEEIHRANYLGGVNVLEAVREAAPRARVLVAGSAAEYGPARTEDMPIAEDCVCRPSGAYGRSKHALCLAALDSAHRRGLKVVVARPFNVVGAGVPPALVVGAVLERARRALAGPDPPVVAVGNVDSMRDFIAVEDLSAAYLRMIRGDFWGEAFNLCSGVPRRIRDVVELLLAHSPRPITYRVDPQLVNPDDVPVFFGNCDKASRAFGFALSIGLEESLQSAWEYAMRP